MSRVVFLALFLAAVTALVITLGLLWYRDRQQRREHEREEWRHEETTALFEDDE